MSRRRITLTLGTAAGGLLAVGLGIGAALAGTPGVASGDSSTDWFSSIDQLLGGLSAPATTSSLDMQVSIDATDLFPAAGNTATATSDMGDIAIAIGNGADASATNGFGDFALADGANSIAEAGFIGNFDSALVFGADSTAEAGFGATFPFPLFGGMYLTIPANFDLAAAFGDMLHATITATSFATDIVP
jgi:hypothetical protein